MAAVTTFLATFCRARYGRQFSDRARFVSWQNKQIAKHLRRLANNCPFYRGQDPTKLSSWPVMDKGSMMANFDSLSATHFTKEVLMNAAVQAETSRNFEALDSSLTVGLSSGTSGNRGLFIASATEQAAWAGTVLGLTLPHFLFKSTKIALFLRANNALYERCNFGAIQFHFFDLVNPLEESSNQLVDLQPDVLVAPPSVLSRLSSQVPNLRPKKVYSVAEVLDPHVEKELEQSFNGPIHQIYQATEGFLGITCRHGSLHLNEDLIHFEFQSLGENRVSPIVTDFKRRTQPIVRYRLDDILVLNPEPCPCGSVLQRVKAIEGRCDDVLELKGTAGKPVTIFPDFVVRAITNADPALQDFRVVQTATNHLRLELPTESRVAEITAALTEFLEDAGVTRTTFSFSPYHPPAPLTKERRVQNIMCS